MPTRGIRLDPSTRSLFMFYKLVCVAEDVPAKGRNQALWFRRHPEVLRVYFLFCPQGSLLVGQGDPMKCQEWKWESKIFFHHYPLVPKEWDAVFRAAHMLDVCSATLPLSHPPHPHPTRINPDYDAESLGRSVYD